MSDGEKTPCVYIMASARNGTLYTGVTSDLINRVSEHKQGLIDGFTKTYRVHMLVYYELHETFDAAFARETRIKGWKRVWKLRLIESMNPDWIDLFDERTGTILDGPADLARRRR
jgi:putative endonuclease